MWFLARMQSQWLNFEYLCNCLQIYPTLHLSKLARICQEQPVVEVHFYVHWTVLDEILVLSLCIFRSRTEIRRWQNPGAESVNLILNPNVNMDGPYQYASFKLIGLLLQRSRVKLPPRQRSRHLCVRVYVHTSTSIVCKHVCLCASMNENRCVYTRLCICVQVVTATTPMKIHTEKQRGKGLYLSRCSAGWCAYSRGSPRMYRFCISKKSCAMPNSGAVTLQLPHMYYDHFSPW